MKNLLLPLLLLLLATPALAAPYQYTNQPGGTFHTNLTAALLTEFALELDPEAGWIKFSGSGDEIEFALEDNNWNPFPPAESTEHYFDPVSGLFGTPYMSGTAESLFASTYGIGVQSVPVGNLLAVFGTIYTASHELQVSGRFSFDGPAPVHTPEPASLLLLAFGAAGYLVRNSPRNPVR